MTGEPIDIRRLLPSEAELYREVRLEGLRDSPDAFGSTHEREAAEPIEWFAQRLAASAVFGAFRGEELLGIAGFYVEPGEKHAHKGVLVGMYVRPQARGAGVGARLAEAVIAQARRHVELIQLRVVSDNAPARRLYERLGFVEYGVEWHAAKYRGRYHDDVLMMLPLVVHSGPDTTCAAAEAAPA
jgi:RimJ/RimL family protein N-acetyltransferase